MKNYPVRYINPHFFLANSLKYYYALYPSKRQKGPFVTSDETFLLSMFKGKELLFEREIPLSDIIGE